MKTSIDYDVERRVYVCSVSGIVNWCCCYGIHYGGSSELKIDLQYNLAIPPLSIYMKELKSGSQRAVKTSVSIGELFIITKRYK